MKTRASSLWHLIPMFLALLPSAFAQDPNSEVTISATDPQASEAGLDPGMFTVRRTGSLSYPLIVFYQLSGTASNGVDYERLSGSVEIPAGASAVSLAVRPIDDSLVEGNETVVARLFPSPLACATCGYVIGPLSNAIVVIADNDFDRPPGVNIYATDALATEQPALGAFLPDTATFTVRRSGDANEGIVVFYTIGGTASNGDDYRRIPNYITLPPGVSSAEIVVDPIDDNLAEGTETVTLTLIPQCAQCLFANPPCDVAVGTNCFQIGPDNQATAYIRDNDPAPTNHPPGVNIYATDPFGAEQPAVSTIPPDTATFTVRRGDATADIVVFYTIGGTASNGDDYRRISNYVTLPAGVSSAQIVIDPIDDTLVEGAETVTLTLIPQCPQCLFADPPCLVLIEGTNCFQIGPDNQATVYIRDNDAAPTNHAPSVYLVRPQNGQTFTAPTNIQLVAFAQDEEDHYDLTVEFFEGTHSLGFGTFVPGRCAECPNYELTWSNMPPGEYTLTARATDSAGASSVSQPVHVTVFEGTPPPGAKLWEFSEGIVYNDPAVWRDGTIYVPQGNDSVSLWALTPDGEVKWARVLAGGGSSPALGEDGTIYVAKADGQNTFRAYSPAGNLLWSIPLNVSGTFQGFASPAIAHDGTIYVGANGSLDKGLYALRPDGTQKWRFIPAGREVLTPAVGIDGTIYFGVLNDGLYALNPDGTLRWQLPMTGYHIWAAVGGDGTIYVTGSTSPTKLFAFTPAGVKLWETQIGPTSSQHASAPVIGLDGSIFVVADQLYAFNSDGSAKWAFDTPGNAWSSLRPPAIDSQGNIYAGLGDFVAVNGNGSLLWSFAANATTSPTLTPDGKIYVGAGDILYALQANAGLAQSPWPMFQRDPRHTGAAPFNPTTRPVVNIVARDPIAVEGPFCFSNWWWTASGNSGGWTTVPGLIDPNRCSGTNTATFVVRRSGPTNVDLTVTYEIGGTASNGVDYVALSGSVTIPAGKRSGQVVITPRDDTIAEGLESVVLRLHSSPDYTIGIPARAAALIVDNDRPRPPCRMLSDRQFHFCNPATNGYCYRIEASTDLVNWTSVCTNIVTDGALHFIDPDAPPINARFYRALPEPGLPPDD